MFFESRNGESAGMAKYSVGLQEDELKKKVAVDWFAAFDATRSIGKVDFCVAIPATELSLFEAENALWAEAKAGIKKDIRESFVQLILTIGKACADDAVAREHGRVRGAPRGAAGRQVLHVRRGGSVRGGRRDALMSATAAEGKRELNVIVKSDTQGSLEAIVQALEEIKSEKVGLNVIGTGTGNVSLTDVKSAAAGKAIVVGFDIGNDSGVQQQARHDGVRINSFRIIYELLDHVKNSMLDMLPPECKEVVLGHAEIKAIYDIGKLGKIAGSQMLDGKLVAKEKYRILRSKALVWDGKVQTLRHFKDEVKEVTGQQECGVCFEGFEGFQVGDTIECYQLEELPRSL